MSIILGVKGKTQTVTFNGNFEIVTLQNYKKSFLKLSIEKTVLFDFVNLSTMFCLKLSDVKIYF